MKKVAFHNLGCKVNSYEMEYMQQEFEKNGYEIVPFAAIADIYVVNTCTVTNIADRKSRQMLHQAKKRNPEALVVAAGCYAQTADRDRTDAAVDLYVGNNRKKEIVSIVEEALTEGRSQRKVIDDLTKQTKYEDLFLKKTMEHTRVSVKIQDGCNQFCSYCIIPYARGRSRSRKKEDVLKEITALASKGYKEVVLTGIHLSSYGIDLDKKAASYNEMAAGCAFTNRELLDLITEASKTLGIRRVRLGSLEPRIITEEFLRTLKETDAFCDHFHLSLQSGSDSVLKRMNRHYSAEEYLEKVSLIRSFYPAAALTTDVITGFPGETEEEFEESRQFLTKAGFYEVHVFKYSRRKGTVADKMEGQLTESVKNARSRILIEDGMKRKHAFLEKQIGKSVEVLAEEFVTHDNTAYLEGFSKNYIRCAIRTDEEREIISGRITGFLTDDILEVCADK